MAISATLAASPTPSEMNRIAATVAGADDAPVARFGNQQMQLPPLSGLRHAEGREIVVGVRPEYAQPSRGDAPGRVSIAVDLVEPLGSEALLHATLQGEPFILKAETLSGLGDLHAVDGFTVPPHLLRVFDAETGRSLGRVEVA